MVAELWTYTDYLFTSIGKYPFVLVIGQYLPWLLFDIPIWLVVSTFICQGQWGPCQYGWKYQIPSSHQTWLENPKINGFLNGILQPLAGEGMPQTTPTSRLIATQGAGCPRISCTRACSSTGMPLPSTCGSSTVTTSASQKSDTLW